MAFAMTGNKREVPGGLPPVDWFERVLRYERLEGLSDLPWYHPVMEHLSPEELARLRAKALIWREVEGIWPEELSWWWEVRMARRRGDLPHMSELTTANIDEDGVLHCGFCGARWSANTDGTPHPTWCKLCDRNWIVIEDRREVTWRSKPPSRTLAARSYFTRIARTVPRCIRSLMNRARM